MQQAETPVLRLCQDYPWIGYERDRSSRFLRQLGGDLADRLAAAR